MNYQVHLARLWVDVTKPHAEAPLVRGQNARDPRRIVAALLDACIVGLYIEQQYLGRRCFHTN